MIVGVHYNIGSEHYGNESQNILRILKHNKIKKISLYAGDRKFWKKVKKCDLVIFQWNHHDYYRQIARSILPVIESQLNIRCYPNSISSWLYDDKIREYYFLKELKFPMVESWIFYDYNLAFDFVDKAIYPIVFKIRSGAGSRMVVLIENKNMAKRYVRLMFRKGVRYDKNLPGVITETIRNDGIISFVRKRMGKVKQKIQRGDIYFQEDWALHKNYILFQKYLPMNNYDTRVVVIGSTAFAFKRFNRPNDFRASGSKSFSFDPSGIDIRFIKIAFQISNEAGFDTMAYDFLYDKKKQPAIAEISYAFSTMMGSKVNQCPGYWDNNLKWHDNQPDVAYFILRHLLNRPDLKRP